MFGILIDDKGEFWSERAPVLHSSIAATRKDASLVGYLVRNMGFVAIDIFGTACQVRLRPTATTHAALQRTLDWLRAQAYERIVIAALTDTWSMELFGSLDKAEARLVQLVDASASDCPEDFIAVPRQLSELSAFPSFDTIASNWDLLRRQLNHRKLTRMVSAMTGGRFILTAPDNDSGQLLVTGTGFGYKTLDRKWALEARGLPLAEQPDRSYGGWLERSYTEVLRSQKPAIEDVDAVVCHPDLGRYRLRYTRFILPGETDGRPWLLSSSLLDERIDLRTARSLGGVKPLLKVAQ